MKEINTAVKVKDIIDWFEDAYFEYVEENQEV